MEGPISFWGYKEQESNLILPEHDDDDDDEKGKEINVPQQRLKETMQTSGLVSLYSTCHNLFLKNM